MADDIDDVPLEPLPTSLSIDGLSVHSTSYCGNPRVEIPNPDNDYAIQRRRAVDHLTPHGVRPQTAAETEADRNLTKKVLKSAASNILQLDVSRISFPVAFSEPRSFLERLADLFSPIVTNYLDRVIFESDPSLRLQIFTIGVMASFHLDMSSKKPWNPILGETFVCKWLNGVQFYAEQISHHPPISAIQLFSANNGWSCHGHCSGRTSSGVNSVSVEQKGTFSLTLDDGTEFEWQFPTIRISGNVSGERTIRVKGPFSVFDRTNDVECRVEIHPKKEKKKGTENSIATSVVGGVRIKKDRDPPATITGDYCGKLSLNGEVLWDIEDPIVMRPDEPVADSELLLSDCRYRLDRNLFIQGRLEEADAAKLVLEGLQRKEAALRGERPSGSSSPQEAPPESPPIPAPATGPPAPKDASGAGKSFKGGLSAFKKFAGKQLAKLG